ncbi:DegT/DnrJ/EryC1/StrS family aminotransferase [bacterium]|nr:MAG: DegT/DnrJ/EryC1/StrS family aminotransferase [bacterium]
MPVPFYDVKAQYDELASEIDAAVHAVVSGGRYVLGPEHNAFEAEIAAYQGVKHALGVANGTDALRISMDSAGIGPGDEVITTAFTFVASTETIVQVGATPVFVDIEPETFQIDPALIEAAITPKTKAILPIHLFGQVCDMDAIMEIANRHGLLVIEDAAQAIGAKRNGTSAGNWGLVSGVSFYVTKNLGAVGDAGMILTNDDETAERVKSFRIHGMGRERYYYDHIGYTSRLDEIQAAFMRVKLRRLDAWTGRRAEIAAIYNEGLAETAVTPPVIAPGVETTWHQYSVRTSQRKELETWLKEGGISSMIYYPVPLHFHAPYAKYNPGEGKLSITEQISREILNLPIHPHLTDEQAQAVVERVQSFRTSAF